MVAIFHTCTRLVEQDIDLKVTNKLCASSSARSRAIGWVGAQSLQSANERYDFVSLPFYFVYSRHITHHTFIVCPFVKQRVY